MATDLTRPDPTVVLDLMAAYRWSKVMFAGVELGVFDALAGGARTVEQLAEQLHLHPEALERLLNAAVGLQLLTRDGRAFANSPAAQAYLTCSSPDRLTGYIHYSNHIAWKLWAHLEDAVREGTHRWKQAFGWDEPIFASFFKNEEARREFLMGMHGYGRLTSPAVVEAFDLLRFRTLVDLGGATGHLAIAACRRWTHLKAIVFDLPDVTPLASEIITASCLSDRIQVRAGDFFNDPLPEGDLYALGRVLHDWSEEKCLRLLQGIHKALPEGGALLVVEKMLWEDKSGPLWALAQDLNMLTCTEGRERTLREYESLLQKAGFGEVVGCRTPWPADAILATKVSGSEKVGS